MYRKSFFILFVLLVLNATLAMGQKTGQPRVDSLLAAIPGIKSDTDRFYTTHALFLAYINLDEDKLAPIADGLLSLAKHLRWQKGLAIAYIDAGDVIFYKKSYPAAMDYYQKAITIARGINNIVLVKECRLKICNVFSYENNIHGAIAFLKDELSFLKPGDEIGEASLLNDIGVQYRGLADYTEALKYYNNSLALVQKTNFTKGVASITLNIGDIYNDKEEYDKALPYILKAISLFRQLDDNVNITLGLSALATAYTNLGDYEKALHYDLDALKIQQVVNDKSQLSDIMINIASLYYNLGNYNEALQSNFKSLKLLEDIGTEEQIAVEYGKIADVYFSKGSYNDASTYYLKALNISEKSSYKSGVAGYTGAIGTIYESQGDYAKAMTNFTASLNLYQSLKEKNGAGVEYLNIGNDYKDELKRDLAVENYKTALKLFTESNNRVNIAKAISNTAAVYVDQKKYTQALVNFQKALKLYTDINDNGDVAYCEGNIGLTELCIARDSTINPGAKKKELQLAITTLEKSSAACKKLGMLDFYQNQLQALSAAYELDGRYDNALNTYKEFITYRDSVYNLHNSNEITKRELQYDFGKREDSIKYKQTATTALLKQQTLLATQQKQALLINGQRLSLATQQREVQRLNFLKTQADLNANKNSLRISQKEQALAQTNLRLQSTELSSKRTQNRYFIIGLIALVILSFFIGLNYYNQHKANGIIIVANKQIEVQKAAAENRLAELIVAQNQLVQAEKLASLGELTAGIAHEIQNPLNFVNNFSEINTELLDEMQEEIQSGNMDEVKALALDIKANQLKINQHGKRADFIVKGMLQHSRASTGERQLTNVNLLVQEFVKLSYQALRTKDKLFNAEIILLLAPELPRINIVQQDIGRVMLNFFNNAFYSVNQKQKKGLSDYKPKVIVKTLVKGSIVSIHVKDNGDGIPDSIKEKIMQPFFTTKPTGDGTGLGLSLSYDIVYKGHNGTITVYSNEGDGAEFIVNLPAA